MVQQPHEGGVCGPGSFRFVTGGQGFGSGIPAVLESGEVAQRDRVQNAGRIRRRTWAGLRYAPSAPSSITKPTDSHKHWYIKRGQAIAPVALQRVNGRIRQNDWKRLTSLPRAETITLAVHVAVVNRRVKAICCQSLTSANTFNTGKYWNLP